MAEDLNQRLEQSAAGGTPQTKPDERRRFLGSLRERVLVRMSVEQVQDSSLDMLFLKHIPDFKGYTVLINGKMPQNKFLDKIMSTCSKDNVPFTLINDESAQNKPEASGILVVSKQAINHYRIDITQVYGKTISPTSLQSPQKKTSFWKRIFHKD